MLPILLYHEVVNPELLHQAAIFPDLYDFFSVDRNFDIRNYICSNDSSVGSIFSNRDYEVVL